MKSKALHPYKHISLGMIGTLCEYYNVSIFGFLAPILSSVFFPQENDATALVYYFLSYGLSVSVVPFGAWLFGRLGDRRGRKRALSISILGMSIATGLIAIIPTHQSLGIIPACVFMFLVAVQEFCAAGEYNGGAIFCLEHTVDKNKRGLTSGLYCASTVLGIILAAGAATLVSYIESEHAWRYAFLIGSCTCFIGIAIRRKAEESDEFITHQKAGSKVDYKQALCLIGATGFFCVVYSLPVQVMNVLTPMMSTIALSTVLLINTLTLCVYAITLLITGYYADVLGYRRMMIIGCVLAILLAYPLFKLAEINSIVAIIVMKIAFLTFTAIFISPFHPWAMNLFPVNKRYQWVSLCYAFGNIITCTMPAIAIWSWDKYQNLTTLTGMMIVWAFIGIFSIIYSKSHQQEG